MTIPRHDISLIAFYREKKIRQYANQPLYLNPKKRNYVIKLIGPC